MYSLQSFLYPIILNLLTLSYSDPILLILQLDLLMLLMRTLLLPNRIPNMHTVPLRPLILRLMLRQPDLHNLLTRIL